MLNALFGGGDLRTYLIQLLLSLPIVLFALCLHETAHGFVAYKLGDPTAKSLGRLSLSPLKHLDPIGFLCMLLCGVGWAKPVPINTRYFKKPRRDMALTALAGPVSNLLLAALFTLLLKVADLTLMRMSFPNETAAELAGYFVLFLYLGVRLNVTLAVFNLLPVPPFDGSRIAAVFLPYKVHLWIWRHERIFMMVMLALLIVGVFDPLINLLTDSIMKLLFAAGFLQGSYFWSML